MCFDGTLNKSVGCSSKKEVMQKKTIRLSVRMTALLAALTMTSSVTKAAQPKTETAADIIEKAYTLSQQKERQQAVLMLVNAVKKEGKKNQKVTRDLLRALDQVSGIFYQDKAQQLYELGLSLKLSDPQVASQKMAEALKLEPDNQAIQISQVRFMIELGECSSAIAQAKKIKEANPFSEEIDLVLSQASVCVGQFEAYLALRTYADDKKSPLISHWNAVELEYQFKAGNFSKMLQIAKAAEESDPAFPETYYWEWRVQVESKLKAEDSAGKYIKLCKGLSPRAQRVYVAEPFLCRRTLEVESFLKKNNNTSL